MNPRALLALVLLLAGALSTRAQTLVAQWNFNNTDSLLAASTGVGTLTLIGGVSGTSASGTGSSDPVNTGDNALNLASFPAQGANQRGAGIEIAASTAGYRNVRLQFDFRASNTGSRRVQVLYTVNGTDYQDGPAFTITTASAFTNGLTADFSAIPAINDNPLFRVRIVSDFDGTGYVAVNGNYGTAGTWRFDMVTLAGESSGVSSAPTILDQPQDLTAFIGAEAQFTVAVTGTQPLSFQWRYNNEPIPGATGQTLSLPNLTTNQQGRYSVVVTNLLGRATSEDAVLTVVPDPATLPATIASVRERFAGVRDTNTNNVASTNLFTVEGVVTTHVSLTTAGNALFYMQDDTAGIPVFWGSAGFVPNAGDRVRIRSAVTFFNGLLELVPAVNGGTVTLLSTNNLLPAPRALPLDALVTRQDGSGPAFDHNALEAYEGSLVTVTNIQLDLATANFPSGNNVTMLDAAGMAFDPALFNLRIDSRVTEVIGQPKPVGLLNITAVLGQFDTSNPRTVGYQLLPTRQADFTTDRRPPVVRFTNVLSNLVRPGDLPANTFSEITLLPGESLDMNAVCFDIDGLPVEIATGGEPSGSVWTVNGSGTTNPAVSLDWTASAVHEGVASTAYIEARTTRATNRVEFRLYTPTASEQGIVITEFMPAPTDVTNSPAYNLLRRESYPPFNANQSPGNLDEYVEIVNFGSEPLDLIAWTLADSVADTHQFFAPLPLASSNAVVVYGGPLNLFAPNLPAGVLSEPASLANGGRLLALNNGGDTITLRNADRRLIARIVYGGEGTNIASQARFPSMDGAFVPHTSIGGRYGSPGLRPGGALWSESDTAVIEPPTISVPPASRTNFTGTLATFSVTALGTPPFTYQWRRGTTVLPGQTNATLSILNVQQDAQGQYSVTVSNSAGSVTSDPATLTVLLDTSNIRPIAELRALVNPLNSTNDVLSTETYTAEGVVTTHVNLTGTPNNLFYLQDATGGIAVFWRNATVLARAGDRVRVTAPLSFFNGLLQFAPNGTNIATAVSVISPDNALPAPLPLAVTAASDFAGIESVEGRRVVLQGVRFDLGSANFSAGQNITVTNADGATGVVVRIDSRAASIIGQPRPTGPVNVVGVLGQFDTSNPRDSGYQVLATRIEDITPGEAPPAPIRVTASGAGAGVRLTWNTQAGRTYRVLRSTALGGTAAPVAVGLTAGEYLDTPPAGGAFFYRIASP